MYFDYSLSLKNNSLYIKKAKEFTQQHAIKKSVKRERQEVKVDKEDKKVDIQIESKEKEKKEESEASDETSSEAEWSDFYVC